MGYVSFREGTVNDSKCLFSAPGMNLDHFEIIMWFWITYLPSSYQIFLQRKTIYQPTQTLPDPNSPKHILRQLLTKCKKKPSLPSITRGVFQSYQQWGSVFGAPQKTSGLAQLAQWGSFQLTSPIIQGVWNHIVQRLWLWIKHIVRKGTCITNSCYLYRAGHF